MSLADNDLITKYETDFNLTFSEITSKIKELENEASVGMFSRVIYV